MFRSSGFHQSIAVMISVAMWLGIIHFVSILIERVMQ